MEFGPVFLILWVVFIALAAWKNMSIILTAFGSLLAALLLTAVIVPTDSQRLDEKPKLASVVVPNKIVPKEDQDKYAAKGESIYSKWNKLYPSMRLRVIGQVAMPTVELCVPRALWNKASKEEQISLTYFVEYFVVKVKGNPVPHTLGDVSAPLGSRYQAERISNISPASWYLSTGIMRKGNSEVVSCDENAVHGDDSWYVEKKEYEKNKWGVLPLEIKASVFRGLE